MRSAGQLGSSELFIVDNSDADWKVLRYVRDWCQISHQIDVAAAYFEIGALLALDGEWQKVDHIRILMGDEASKRTKNAIAKAVEGIRKRLDDSIEQEKLQNDFLRGVDAIVDALKSGKIQCRVYRKDKFHAKAYITHGRLEVVGSAALVGSSNFTVPGLTQNIELNVQITGTPVAVLQDWYERHWEEAEDVTPEILQTVERHTRDYSPFEVYARSLQLLVSRQELEITEWERHRSLIYPKLSKYQRDGYGNLLHITRQKGFRGAFLCDGVGLGKTFIGMMLIERLIQERKNVMLLVPKSGRKAVWEASLKKHLPRLWRPDFGSLAIFNHTDLQRSNADIRERLHDMNERADVIIIDEAHNFRNRGVKGEGRKQRSRYWHLYDICEGKEIYFLTATPVNNRLLDLLHMIELFSRNDQAYFQSLGINSLRGYFRKLEKDLEKSLLSQGLDPTEETTEAQAEEVLQGSKLVEHLVVQRSRAYVKKSQQIEGGSEVAFPKREDPKVAPYDLKKIYGTLLDKVDEAFSRAKPLFSLPIYDPYSFYIGDEKLDEFTTGRQKQVVALIRTGFLKRFESSAVAFDSSCQNLFLKVLAFVAKHSATKHDKDILERWIRRHQDVIAYIQSRQAEWNGGDADEEDSEEDIISEEMLENVEELDPKEFNIQAILKECYNDLDQLLEFIKELMKFKPANDDKLQTLIRLLTDDTVLSKHKVIIFSQFTTTARYVEEQLKKVGIDAVEEVDSGRKVDRLSVIRRFAPYYNDSSSADLAERKEKETRVLIATDVLSEGLNLQDATRLINYDLHWNPVRLMQRIGRVDRRMNPDIEAQIVADHPDQKDIRGTAAYWNFLPPDEMEELLKLYGRVSHKTLRISKLFGIEGKRLLTPNDDYEALKDFNEAYEGQQSPLEELRNEFTAMVKADRTLPERLDALPGKVFSGKRHPKPRTEAVFFCFSIPGPRKAQPGEEPEREADLWTEEAGSTAWYLYDVKTGDIWDEAPPVATIIRAKPETKRETTMSKETLSEIRAKVEKHVKNTVLRQMQAPVGVKPSLKAWMELN